MSKRIRNAEQKQMNRDRAKEYRDRVAERVRAIKLDKGCMDCGYNSHVDALEFDHRTGTEKLFSIKHGRTITWQLLEAEMAKCDVVCANCHNIRTAQRIRDAQRCHR